MIKEKNKLSKCCNNSVQKLLSPYLPKTLKIKMCVSKTLFTIFLYNCEMRFLILKAEYKLQVYENKVLRKILRPKKD